ncbi:MAG: glycosyltransferase [Gammaproteobacteria bacterium]|nr:glycosyltransferase [Gammaproteobacteria bacterium]
MSSPKPSLSVIVPTLNEEKSLPQLLSNLAEQRGIIFEIILADGGSHDNTLSISKQFTNVLTIKIVRSGPGRGRQMNQGARSSTATELLFLHADSKITEPYLLHNAQQHFGFSTSKSKKLNGNTNIAGHFGLKFLRQQSDYQAAYYFYESKTHLNRPDSINGDQGFWITRRYFDALKHFDESLPYMEDARLALQIFKTGQWITLPGIIETSARRFELEGLKQRQILNSFMCNFNALGLSYFFDAALDAYKSQDKSNKLILRPFLNIAHQQILRNGWRQALKRWYQTGGYIADNAWQLAFAMDCRKNRKKAIPSGKGPTPYLHFHDQWLARVISSPPCRAITGLLTIIWFYSLFLTRQHN